MLNIIIACLFLGITTSTCIFKNTQQKPLQRGELAFNSETTCSRLLPKNDYKSLSQQLKPSDPLFVVSTNDLHGHTDARNFNLQASESEVREVSVGGLERLASYLTALCKAAKTRLIYLDSGDSYQGTALSNSSNGIAIIDSFASLGLMASTFGNHEFDFGQDKIKAWLNLPQRNFWYVTSSVSALADGKSIPWQSLEAPRFARSVVFDVAGVKVGIAGYTTESTAIKSLPDNVKNLNFGQLSQVLNQESAALRKNGAEVTILLSHAGGSCDMKLKATQAQIACKDSEHDELGQTLRAHPENAQKWDLIVAGHSHSAQRHFISGVPVIQTTGLGLSFAYAQIRRSENNTTTDLFDPIYLCANHFEFWKGCHPQEWQWQKDRIGQLGKAVLPSVEGQEIRVQDGEKTESALSPWREKLREYLNKVVTMMPANLAHERTQLSPAGACLVDAWLTGLKNHDEHWGEFSSKTIDGAFLNAGALRSGLSVGPLTRGKLFEIIPYDNTAHIVTLTNSEIIKFAQSHEESPHDYLLVSEGWSVSRKSNVSPSPRTFDIINTKSKKDSHQKWVVAISTFSKSFLDRAGINAVAIDSGLSIRDTIALSLEKQRDNLPSCKQPNLSRMQIESDTNGG